MNFSKNISDKIYFINNGIIEVEGTFNDIINSNNELLKEFLKLENKDEE